ncbi:MAG: polysaccharide deacetylase family protein [Parcubacteria group bacterium]|nr:polysaccharide deacetylase family protein [Parcubacteria group bacterium]
MILIFALIGLLHTSSSFAAEKLIVLTFDDGPRPYVLENLLPLLQKYSAPATFFMIGAKILPNDKLVKKMSENGYEIENHSWGHENLVKLLREKGALAVKLNLEKTSNLIFKITGRKPRFFRPPYWEINADVEKVVRDLGLVPMKLDNPDINTMDYTDFSNHRPVEVLIDRVKKNIERREKQNFYKHILTFHELPLTVEALKVLIPYFQGQGYKFIRLDQ